MAFLSLLFIIKILRDIMCLVRQYHFIWKQLLTPPLQNNNMQQIELLYDASFGSVQKEKHFTFIKSCETLTSYLSKNREKQHADELWSIQAVLVDLAYLKEPVVNAFQVVSFTRKKRHFQPSVK